MLKVLPFLLVLGGCMGMTTQIPITISCPAIRQYTLDEQKALAQELKKTPENSLTRRFIKDYGELRDQTRACQGIK